MNTDRIDQHIDDAAERLKRPLDVPRDRMWERIDAARKPLRGHSADTFDDTERGRHPRTRRSRLYRWWPAAAAALLVLGFGLGRVDWTGQGPVPVVTGPDSTTQQSTDVAETTTPHSALAAVASEERWTAATLSTFQRAETILTAFDQSKTAAPVADPIPRWASLLLYETRVLMDAPAAGNPEMMDLLMDLELVLAQIADLQADDRSRDPSNEDDSQDSDRLKWAGRRSLQSDRVWIADGLAKRATLQRLRQLTQADAEQNSL